MKQSPARLFASATVRTLLFEQFTASPLLKAMAYGPSLAVLPSSVALPAPTSSAFPWIQALRLVQLVLNATPQLPVAALIPVPFSNRSPSSAPSSLIAILLTAPRRPLVLVISTVSCKLKPVRRTDMTPRPTVLAQTPSFGRMGPNPPQALLLPTYLSKISDTVMVVINKIPPTTRTLTSNHVTQMHKPEKHRVLV